MTNKEIFLLIIIPISIYFIYKSFQMINQLSKQEKISSSKRNLLIYFTILAPILGWIRVRYEQNNFKTD